MIATLKDFYGSNGLTAFIETFILIFFTGGVVAALIKCTCFLDLPAPPPGAAPAGNLIQRLVAGANFTHGSTIVAGLILTAATGVLGTPTDIKIGVTTQSEAQSVAQAVPKPATTGTTSPATTGTTSPATTGTTSPATTKPPQSTAQLAQNLIKDPQREAFKKICAWLYVVLGALCFFVWAIPTRSNHDLVRNVGLTTLGFATSIISNLQLPASSH